MRIDKLKRPVAADPSAKDFQIQPKQNEAIVIKSPNGDVVRPQASSRALPYAARNGGSPLVNLQFGSLNASVENDDEERASPPGRQWNPTQQPSHELATSSSSNGYKSYAAEAQDHEAALAVQEQEARAEKVYGSDAESMSTSSKDKLPQETGKKHASDTMPHVAISQSLTARPTPPSGTRSTLNIHAQNHIPYWLRAVNESFAVTIPGPLLARVDFDAYRATFMSSRHWAGLPRVELPPPRACRVFHQGLDTYNYEQYWHERLHNEFAATNIQNVAFGVYNIKIEQRNATQLLYQFKVPGLRESTPRIDLGDVLCIRQLVPYIAPEVAQQAHQWTPEANRLAIGFTGIEHQAVVWSLVRRDELVIVRLGKELLKDGKSNVIIPLQAHKNAPAWRAVMMAGKVLGSPIGRRSWERSMLFPNKADGIQQTKLPKGSFGLEWYDTSLNFEQKRAVQAVVGAKYGQVPYLLSGPPGTGKTKTMVEIAMQLINQPSKVTPHLLICAPSDSAADTLLVRLSAYLPQRGLFRLNNWTRLFSEVPGEVRPYSYIDDNHLYSLPDFDELMKVKIVVTTCRDANLLLPAGLTNQALADTTMSMLRTIAPGMHAPTNLIHWTALLLDEAAQATEPEVLIPLSVVAPPILEDATTTFAPQVIMAGDEYQLGPRLISTTISPGNIADPEFPTPGLETSLFARLFSSPLYADHPLSRSNGLRPLTKSLLPIIRPPFANLIRNYRSHPAILTTSSTLFYSDTLVPERPETSPAILSWSRWPTHTKYNTTWPVMFHDHTALDSVDSILEGDGTGSGSLTNPSEARIVINLVTDLLSHVNFSTFARDKPHSDFLAHAEIIIMSPFRAQVSLLRNLFRQRNLDTIRIGPLEAFQGLEARIVIICTTRTRLGQHPHRPEKFVVEDKSRSLGVVDEPKRFNVAMTRAKEGLIVVGSAEVLAVTRDPCWMSFLGFCERNGLCVGERTGWFGRGSVERERVGKLERALRYAEASRGDEGNGGEVVDGKDAMGGGDYEKQDFKFRLQGQMVDLDERMWEMQLDDQEAQEIRKQEEDAFEDDESEEEDEEEGETCDEIEVGTTQNNDMGAKTRSGGEEGTEGESDDEHFYRAR